MRDTKRLSRSVWSDHWLAQQIYILQWIKFLKCLCCSSWLSTERSRNLLIEWTETWRSQLNYWNGNEVGLSHSICDRSAPLTIPIITCCLRDQLLTWIEAELEPNFYPEGTEKWASRTGKLFATLIIAKKSLQTSILRRRNPVINYLLIEFKKLRFHSTST